jgi:hypothetical protein
MDKYLLDAIKRRILSEYPKGITVKIRREPSANELKAEWQEPGTGLLFCVHKKSYFETCTGCKRDTRIAKAHFDNFVKKHNL